ncbi:MAG: hypothetical protein BMS9Abin28_1237 [Anaerolineae bacterium]|nr:MAG: hypothetical protein BMS9Abin28_1237 [Anaerolineae bacterium]
MVAAQFGIDPSHAAAIEDSHIGGLSAHAADMAVIYIPNTAFPPGEEVRAVAGAILKDFIELTVDLIEGMG